MTLTYDPIPVMTKAEIDDVLATADLHRLAIVPLAAALHLEDPLYAEAICVTLAVHADPGVRGNSILAFGHIARIHRRLSANLVRPLILAALSDPHPFVRSQAHAAADDAELYLRWRLPRPP